MCSRASTRSASIRRNGRGMTTQEGILPNILRNVVLIDLVAILVVGVISRFGGWRTVHERSAGLTLVDMAVAGLGLISSGTPGSGDGVSRRSTASRSAKIPKQTMRCHLRIYAVTVRMTTVVLSLSSSAASSRLSPARESSIAPFSVSVALPVFFLTWSCARSNDLTKSPPVRHRIRSPNRSYLSRTRRRSRRSLAASCSPPPAANRNENCPRSSCA